MRRSRPRRARGHRDGIGNPPRPPKRECAALKAEDRASHAVEMNRNDGRIHAPQNAIDGRQTRLAGRAAIAAIDPDLLLSDVRTMEERTTLSMSSRRASVISVVFAVRAAGSACWTHEGRPPAPSADGPSSMGQRKPSPFSKSRLAILPFGMGHLLPERRPLPAAARG